MLGYLAFAIGLALLVIGSYSMIGFSIELAERRYLAGDTSVIIPSELFEVFKEVSNR